MPRDARPLAAGPFYSVASACSPWPTPPRLLENGEAHDNLVLEARCSTAGGARWKARSRRYADFAPHGPTTSAAGELAAFFTDDAVYHNIPLAPVVGREAIANTIATFIRPGPPGIESIEFRVINIAADGPVVMTERVDAFKLPDKSFELPVMGTFEVSDGKINAWRDYFDMNQFTSQMG